MDDYNQLSTSLWTLMLPQDWFDLQDDEAAVHFGADDESKAVYITSHKLEHADGTSEEDSVQWLVDNELSGRGGMEGYNWAFVGPSVAHQDGVCCIVIDTFDDARHYRIVTKLLLRGQTLVRAAFHDYFVEDIAHSIAYFSPVLQSLQFRE